MNSKENALKVHADPLDGFFQQVEEQVSKPVSEVNPMEFHDLIESVKTNVYVCENDLKDAKRRISAAKGSKKKTQAKREESDDEASDQ